MDRDLDDWRYAVYFWSKEESLWVGLCPAPTMEFARGVAFKLWRYAGIETYYVDTQPACVLGGYGPRGKALEKEQVEFFKQQRK